jgi:hypothetical protein
VSFASASRSAPGKRPGKGNPSRFGIRGSTVELTASLRGGARWLPSQLVVQAENSDLGTLPMPKAAESPLLFAFCCFPPASPAFAPGSGKQKTVPLDRSKHLNFLINFGAGEAIRTPDPNLGKVGVTLFLQVPRHSGTFLNVGIS